MTTHPDRTRRCFCLAVLLGFTLLGTSGCAVFRSRPVHDWDPDIHSHKPAEFKLGPGDRVNVTFLGAPELNTSQLVRPDGVISLPLIGDVVADGKPPMQLQEDLKKAYAGQLQVGEASLVVEARSAVYISGAVRRSGPYALTRPTTALEAVVGSGGFDEREALLTHVVVLRQEESIRRGFTLDLSKTLEEGAEGPVFYLQPHDIVYVPRTRIVKANQWIDQYINRMMPQFGAPMSWYSLYNTIQQQDELDQLRAAQIESSRASAQYQQELLNR